MFAILIAFLALQGTTATAQAPTAPLQRAGGHVAVAECARCHEGQQRKLARSPHGAVLAAAALPGCETCHGPGAEHAADEGQDLLRITMPQKLAAAAQEQLCGRCHRDQIEHHGGDMAGFRQAGKGCTDCHEVHAARKAAPLGGVALRARRDVAAAATPIGSAACVECHPLREERLAHSDHAPLSAHDRSDGCEICHGPGSLHASSNGRRGLIARPDRATDGAAVCRGCHAAVDERTFHWRDRRGPYLGADVTCATCHRVHEAKTSGAPRPANVGALAAMPAATNALCARCHAPALCTMPGSTHASLGAPGRALAAGCGACHRGAEEHARGPGRRSLVQRLGGAPAAQQAAICLSCHRRDDALRTAEHGVHQQRGVGCADCHGPLHGADPTTVAASAEQSCRRCHAAVVAEFAQPNHHPVPEGRMRCSSCHDVHQDRARVRDLELGEARCVACHPRYAGPFVFAHQAGRRDGCVVCHVPHGSSNRRLLQQHTSQQNCLQCHGDFPVFHDQTPGAVFTDCMRCHTEVHGSNHSRFLFR